CGEHGGEPISVRRFRQAGLDYVSASPYRVPIAYLQSAIDNILVKQGKPLPPAPEFKLLADEEVMDEEVMKAPQEIKPIPAIKDASSIEEALSQAVTLVKDRKITKKEAIGNLDLSKLAGGLSQGLLGNSDFQRILSWAKEIKSVGIEALVENEQWIARLGGLSQAEGIFVQTENTFLDIIEATRRLIFADTDTRRKEEMEKLAKLQSGFYNALFDKQNLSGRAVTIRLLNLGLKSFIQGLTAEEIDELAAYLGIDRGVIQKKIKLYFENNPSFGNKGSRLALTLHPDLYRAQLRAIFLASIAQEVSSEVNILAPFLIEAKEFIAMKELIEEVANQVRKETGKELKYKIIPAIATPRASLSAERFAPETDSAVIDAVELTDGVLGMTKADAQKFLPDYLKEGIYPADPYKAIYEEAVGLLLREAILRARQVNPNIRFSVRGYSNDPVSLEFFHQAGADTIISSPEDLGLAILSAAQAAIKFPRPAADSSAMIEAQKPGAASSPVTSDSAAS
ncbi:hypothetical protein HZA71_01640, partial [Candidatus Falkowbacteria bacterium]|nr:hypothetical protein [Candidatus Falkowbacteria bacterium]